MKNTLLLDALSNARMFILYRVQPGVNGKTDKLPSHPLTGLGPPDEPRKVSISGLDPANWMLPHEALLWAQQWDAAKPPGVLGYGVGIVIHEGSNLFALDFDSCRDANGGWQPHVLNFESRFPGCYR